MQRLAQITQLQRSWTRLVNPGSAAQELKSFTCSPHCYLTECQGSVELGLGEFREGFSVEVTFELGFKSESFTNV